MCVCVCHICWIFICLLLYLRKHIRLFVRLYNSLSTHTLTYSTYICVCVCFVLNVGGDVRSAFSLKAFSTNCANYCVKLAPETCWRLLAFHPLFPHSSYSRASCTTIGGVRRSRRFVCSPTGVMCAAWLRACFLYSIHPPTHTHTCVNRFICSHLIRHAHIFS